MSQLIRRLTAAAVAVAIAALIVYDLRVPGFSGWWDRHAITTSLVSDLLIVGATALIFDEVATRRQRRERAVTVAVQGMIVYSQAQGAYQAVIGSLSGPAAADGVPGEVQDLANCLLVTSNTMFDDPAARDFQMQLNRLLAALYAAVRSPADLAGSASAAEQLTDRMADVRSAFRPLVSRVPSAYQQEALGHDPGASF